MTKKELEKEATEYATEWGDKTDGTYACCRSGYLAGAEPREKRIEVLEKALYLYVNWADECGVAWDNFPDMKEKWYKIVEEKGLGWIEGLIFMATEEAKEQLMKEQSNSQEVSE